MPTDYGKPAAAPSKNGGWWQPKPAAKPPVKGQPNTTFAGKKSGVGTFLGQAAHNLVGDLEHPTRILDPGLSLIGTSRKQVAFAAQHPLARAENKGPFAQSGPVAGTVPFFGGPKGDLKFKPTGETTIPAYAKRVRKNAAKTPATANTLGESVTGSLQGARKARAEQETLRSADRAARIRAYGKKAQVDTSLAGHQAAKAELAGKYPALNFGGFKEFNQEAFDAMSRHITDHPQLQDWEQVRAKDALVKIRAGKIPTKSEEKLLRVAFGNDATGQLMRSVSKFRQLKALTYDVGNIPRSIEASFDASGLLRQELLIATGHPVIFAKSVPKYLRAIVSEKYYNAGLEGLHQRPNAVNGIYDKMGLDLTELTPRGGSTAAREEAFRSPLAEKIPGVRASGRGFTLGLDTARADLADYLYAKAVKNQGKLVHRIEIPEGKRVPRIVKRAIDPNDPHLLESIGDLVNSASGRGDLGNGVIGRSQEGLNLLLFSPRLIKSRVDFLNPFWYAKLDPLARHQAYRAMGGLVVLVATALEIAKASGAGVNLDPRSSDFAKIKIGNTRLDLAGGFQQYMRLLSEIATQQVVTSSGETQNLGQEGPGRTSDWDVLFKFFRSKLAPITSAGVDLTQRQNVIGQPLTLQNSLVSRVTPFSVQDAFGVGTDVGNTTGSTPAAVLAGLGAFGLSALGGGVQNYTPRKPKSGKGSSWWTSPSPSSPSGGSSGGWWGK